jgi:hypothetical protein
MANDIIDHGGEAIRSAAAAIRGLNPPAAAAEAWVRSKAAEIDAIARSVGLDRPALAHALLSAGVAQRSDRTKPLGPTALSRALRGGRREEADRRNGIELQKLENAVFKTVAALLPSVTEEVARRAAAETIRKLRADEITAPVPAPFSVPAVEPASGGIAAFAQRRREATPNASDKASSALAALDALAPENLNLKPQPKNQGDEK